MEKELKVKINYQIYNKAEKSILTYSYLKDKDKEQLIKAIRHDLGGNSNLVVVISKESMNEWKEKHSEKAKEEARKEAIRLLLIPDGYYSDIKTLYAGQSKAAYNLEEAYSDIPENILYEIDGFSVVYDRLIKK